MGQNKLSDYYETLELTDDASWPEIRRSYLNLKELYSTPSIATQSLNEGMVTEWGEKIIKKIDEAYKGLEEYHKEIRQKNEKKIERIVSEINLFCGSSLFTLDSGTRKGVIYSLTAPYHNEKLNKITK